MRGDRGMKRFNDGFGSGPNKRSRLGPEEIELRVLIPSKVAGSIIGKGGNNIARLRTDAKVTVPDCPGPERILTVIAQEEQAVKVVGEVLPNLFIFQGRGGKPPSDNEEVDLRVLVHQSQAGCVIGKGGGKVKELREKTGAKIKIYSNCCPESTDRVVQINGSPTTAIDCLKEVLELLKSSPVKGVENPYDPNSYDEFYAHEYGGYGAGGAGNGGGGGGGPRNFPPRDQMGRGPPSRFGGGGGGGPGARGGPPMGGRGGGGGGFGGGYGDDDDDYDMPPRMGMGGGIGNGSGMGRQSTQVTIPKDMAGAIIGTAGARIRKVRMDSGADITIDEPLPGSTDRIITITGSSSEIQMAQYLLQQCVHQNMKSAGGGRGGGGRY